MKMFRYFEMHVAYLNKIEFIVGTARMGLIVTHDFPNFECVVKQCEVAMCGGSDPISDSET